MAEDRVLPLEGVHNFRDYGGYRVAGGGRLRRASLWRSGQHHGATEADLEQIEALGLAAVFDLRTDRERSHHPCRRPSGFAGQVHEATGTRIQSAPHVAAAHFAAYRTAESTREGLLRTYGEIAFRPELQRMSTRLIAAASEGTPTLVNCMAGKDRTGIVVATVQLAAGVHRDDVIEDYLLTNTAGDVEARIASGAQTLRAFAGEMDEGALRVLMSVESEYLETAFAAIEREHGAIDGYLETALGIDPAKRERLREALVED